MPKTSDVINTRKILVYNKEKPHSCHSDSNENQSTSGPLGVMKEDTGLKISVDTIQIPSGFSDRVEKKKLD